MHRLGEIGADKSAGAFKNVFSLVRGIRLNKSSQLVESRVGCGSVIGEDDSLSVRAAFYFSVLGIDESLRPAGGKDRQERCKNNKKFYSGDKYLYRNNLFKMFLRERPVCFLC
jgi:hypothetical protein